MNKRKLVVAASLLIGGLIGGAAVAEAATSFTAPKDHAQAFITKNSSNQWVAQRQVGFTNIEHPANGLCCFALPTTANPNKSVSVLTTIRRPRPTGQKPMRFTRLNT